MTIKYQLTPSVVKQVTILPIELLISKYVEKIQDTTKPCFLQKELQQLFLPFGVTLRLLYNKLIRKNNSKTKINLKPI